MNCHFAKMFSLCITETRSDKGTHTYFKLFLYAILSSWHLCNLFSVPALYSVLPVPVTGLSQHNLSSVNFSHTVMTPVWFSSLSFSWTRNGTHFDIDDDPNVTMKPHSGTLVVDISRVKAEHYECVYQCTARNKHGTAVSSNIVVRQSSKCSVVCHCYHLIFHFLPFS